MGFSFLWGVKRSEPDLAKINTDREKIVDTRAMAAECLAMAMFVIIGCGVACRTVDPALVALAFGMGFIVLGYTFGHHSGGHINCAVTLSLVVGGQVPWYQGVANLIAQLVGSLLGAFFLCLLIPCDQDVTKTLAMNLVHHRDVRGYMNVLAGETFGSFLMCFVVWETAISKKSTAGQNACIAIGFAVLLAHLLLLPIDGCSINPTRSFGPAVVGSIRACNEDDCRKGLRDLWVMWFGPLGGAILAAFIQLQFLDLSGSGSVAPLTSEGNNGAVALMAGSVCAADVPQQWDRVQQWDGVQHWAQQRSTSERTALGAATLGAASDHQHMTQPAVQQTQQHFRFRLVPPETQQEEKQSSEEDVCFSDSPTPPGTPPDVP